MPGICGYIDGDGRSAVPSLTAMIAPLVPHAWFVTERHDAIPGAALAAVSLDLRGRESHLAIGGACVCVLDGEFYNQSELLPLLPAEVRDTIGSAPSAAELLRRGWEVLGAEFLRQINGSFSAVLYDPSHRTAVVVTDRFGNRPLYYATDGLRFSFSSRIKSLSADPAWSRAIDPRGVADFFTFGHYLRDHTSQAHVKLVPAAACWTWRGDQGTWRRDTYHAWSVPGRDGPRSRREWTAAIGDAFGRAVRRQTEGTDGLGLSLSGGLDARTILAAIDPVQTPVRTVCLGIPGSLDHRCAERLAAIAGCAHQSHVLDTHFLADYRRHLEWMVRLTDGQYLSQGIVMPTLPVYRELGIGVLLRGHAGELMHMYKAYNYSLDEKALSLGNLAELESWLIRRLSAYMLDGVDKPLLVREYWDSLHEHARQSLAEDLTETVPADPPAQRIWQLFLMQRLRRETVLSLNEFRSVCETRLPFLDNELIALLLAAPPALKLGEDIQYELLRRFRPEFLRVVNANTGAPVGAGAWRRKISSIGLRVLAKLGVPGYQPYERLGLWLKRELRGLVDEILLDPRTLDRGIYQPDTIRTVVEHHRSGQHNHTYLILALMVFELGQRYLEEGEGVVGAESVPGTPGLASAVKPAEA